MTEFEVSSIVVAACATVIAAMISSTLKFLSEISSRKHERKLEVLKILLEAAYKEYEFRTQSELNSDSDVRIKSFTEYIIFYREFAEMFTAKEVTPEEIEKALEKNKILIDSYYDLREKCRPKYHLAK